MKNLKALLFLFILFMFVFALVACGDEGGNTTDEYVVTFTVDGEVFKQIMENVGTTVSLPDAPEKNGYSFDGWATQDGKWDSEKHTSGDVTVSAIYTPITYTITYYTNFDGIENTNVTSYTLESESFTIQPLEAQNYDFLGWYSDEGLEAAADISIEKGSTGNLTFYAKWNATEYTASFVAGGEVVGAVKFTALTSEIVEPSVPGKNGYTGAWESYTVSASDITVNAIYTPITYTITYNVNLDGVTNSNVTSYTVESESFTISPLTAANYDFLGWYSDASLETAADISIEKGSTGNLTFYAKWKETEYTASFVADGAVVGEVKFTASQSSLTEPTVPAKNAYTGAWEVYTLSATNITVNAIYTPIVYTILFPSRYHGVTNNNVNSYTVESETFTLLAPERDYCIFKGWYSDADLTVEASATIEKGSYGNRVYYAKWECTHNYDYSVLTAAGPLTEGLGEYKCSVCDDSYTEAIAATKSIKILAIGNSFSIDAMNYLYGILKEAGVEDINLVNLYIAGCNLDTHWSNMSANADAYDLYQSSDTEKTMVKDKAAKRSIKYAMSLDDFDIVTLQQSSYNSGKPNTYANLQNVINYVKENEPGAKIYWHMTWAYGPENTSLSSCGGSQIGMYNSIVSTVGDKILTNPDIVGVIPVGTAIQNARTSSLGNDLTRDDSHLGNGVGRYVAALTWASVLTGCDVDKISGTPSNASDASKYAGEIIAAIDVIKESVKNAVTDPYKVTDSIYPPTNTEGGDNGGSGGDNGGEDVGGGEEAVNPDFKSSLKDLTAEDKTYLESLGLSADGYKLLVLELKDNYIYNSTTTPPSDQKLGSGAVANVYASTQIFSRHELVVGSIIRIEKGNYRPEGWTALDAANSSRPSTVSTNYVTVTEAWWGSFNYRGFNIHKDGGAFEDVASNFRIYVPVAKTADLNAEDIAYLEGLGLDASEYKVLDYVYYANNFYSSMTSSNLSNPKESSAQYGKFNCTEMLTRYDITLGSIITVKSGYQYRPEGWYDLDDTVAAADRPANVKTASVTVDDAWWANYSYRGLNLSKTDSGIISEAEISALRIYVKIK